MYDDDFDDEDEEDQNLDYFGPCPSCGEDTMFTDPEDREPIAFCTNCGYVQNLDPMGLVELED